MSSTTDTASSSTVAVVPAVNAEEEEGPTIDPTKTYTIQTSDGELFQVIGKVAILSQAIQHAVGVCGEDGTIPLPSVNGTTFKHVLKLFEMWADNGPYEKPPHGGRGMGPDVDSPEFTYMRTIKENQEIYDLCRAGGFLLNQQLADTTVFFVHDLLKDKSVKEMCDFFGEQYNPNYNPAPDAE
uniref:Skp1_POZ domain-containing protein n=1 Tax=Panagrellus redivivus TaxID=6233 RepID=A0A7E4W8U4_PANRE